MPPAHIETPASAEPPPRKRFSRTEFELLLNAGVFCGQKLELIDGDLIDKMGQKPPHASAVQLCLAFLAGAFGIDRVRVQSPVEAGASDQERSLPEPDLAVLAETKVEFEARHPSGSEVMLVVEVADTSLRHDMGTKRDLYCRALVPEYWVLDLNARCLIVHRGLNAEQGRYADVREYSENEMVAAGGKSSRVSALLPKRA